MSILPSVLSHLIAPNRRWANYFPRQSSLRLSYHPNRDISARIIVSPKHSASSPWSESLYAFCPMSVGIWMRWTKIKTFDWKNWRVKKSDCQVLLQIGSFVYYFTILGLLPRSSAAVGYSVLLFVPKKPLLFGCTQCNEVVDTHFVINVVFTSSAAFSGVFFTLILVGFKGRNIAPNMAQCNSMPENHVSRFFR